MKMCQICGEEINEDNASELTPLRCDECVGEFGVDAWADRNY